MKTIIYYFSGTGNTEKVAKNYQKYFEDQNIECQLERIEHIDNIKEINVEEYDFIGFGYPIHAFNAPKIVLEFAKKLKKCKGKKNYFIIKTSGEPLKLNNISSIKLKKILKKKNLILTNEYHYCMPYNIIFRHSDYMAYKMWKYASSLIPIDCQEIIDKKPVKLSKFFMGSFLAWIFRIEFIAGKINSKHYKINDKCIKCMRCVRTCPTGNITIEDGKIKFGKNCIMCMRCSFFCPTNAINIGMFEKWKVNGPYHFTKPENEENTTHKNYCKNSYKKYFKKADNKLANYDIKIEL